MRWKSHCHETAGVPSLQIVFFTSLNHDFKRSWEWQSKKGQTLMGHKWNMFIWSSLDLMLLCMTVQNRVYTFQLVIIPLTYPSLSHIIVRAFKVFELVILNLNYCIKDSRLKG